MRNLSASKIKCLKSLSAGALVVGLLGSFAVPAFSQNSQDWPNAIGNVSCDRECLFDTADQYLEGMLARNPEQVPWAEHVKYTENNVALDIGDGLWGTITGLGDYKLEVADEAKGQVGIFGIVEEPSFSSLYSMRMLVEDKKISEVEIVVLRMVSEPKSIVWPEPEMTLNPIFAEILPEPERRSRERLISIADGYFDTLQLNDGTLFTEFHEDCDRVENGTQTTNNSKVAITSVGKVSCEEQFLLGNYRYDDALRERRFPLVDEERGLVMSSAFIDHSGSLGEYTLTDGRVVEAPIRYPHSFYLLELFKIVDGKIRQIEAVFVTVPYGMPSPWYKR